MYFIYTYMKLIYIQTHIDVYIYIYAYHDKLYTPQTTWFLLESPCNWWNLGRSDLINADLDEVQVEKNILWVPAPRRVELLEEAQPICSSFGTRWAPTSYKWNYFINPYK